MNETDSKQWKTEVYESTVADPEVQERAWQYAEAARLDTDPQLNPMDLAASRRYLETCMMRMSVAELSAADNATLAALWARGLLGAARYRVRKGAAK